MVAWPIFQRAVMITSFVAVMMILVEYFNVLTKGRWVQVLSGRRWTQYLLAAVLGAVPGCLGAFTIVTLYVHRAVSLGAVVACMIATSGDEMFVMLAMFPQTASLMTFALVVVGILAGLTTDWLLRTPDSCCDQMVLHEEEQCRCFNASAILPQLKQPSAARGVLIVGMTLFLLTLWAGVVGPPTWNWIRVTLLLVAAVSLFVVITVPEHFLEEHLWRHAILKHVPRIFLWTLGSMAVIAGIEHFYHADTFIRENHWLVLVVASFVGVIPESGPHLLFVTLYGNGTIPFSILMASSVVQDGHGMLPLLSHSWRDFLKVKCINLLVGLAVGAILLMAGR